MPVMPEVNYPGVYIQEVESDVHTIVPVETATTAFIGRTLRGPVNQPIVINSFADFQRIFGGLWLESNLGYAVNQFFLNGGSKAVIVRLFKPEAAQPARLSVPGPHPAAWRVFKAVAEAATLHGPTAEDLEKAAKRACDSIAEDGKAADEAAKAVKDKVDKSKTAEAVLEAAREAADTATHPAAHKVFNAVKETYDAVKALSDESIKLEALKEAAESAYQGIHNDVEAANQAAQAVKNKVDDTVGKGAGELKPDKITDVLDAAQTALSASRKPSLVLEAKYLGKWGDSLVVRVSDVDPKVSKTLADRYRVQEGELFNLSVRDLKTGTAEYFPNVTVVPGPRRLDKVLDNESELVRVATDLGNATRPDPHSDPEPAKNWWDEGEDGAFSAADGKATDGEALTSTEFLGDEAKKTGIYALEHADIFNLLYIPPYQEEGVDKNVLAAAATYCEKRRAMLLVDPHPGWNKEDAKKDFPTVFPGSLGNNAAIYFPRIQVPNPLRDNQVEDFGPGGVIAGIFARTDAARGVWKAPAGLEATLRGVVGLSVPLTDAENGELNPLGINCMRQMPAAGYVVWGARTIVGDDRLASQWKYIPVRRTALYIEESLYRGTQWAVFEPNDEPLWSQLRLNIGVFMHGLFRQGAFQGMSPKDAYFVKCDSTTTTQADIDRGIVNVIVGFAPLKPAEFVILYIQQIAGQLAV